MASEKAAGIGNKKPQLDIPLSNLLLDNENPRLSDEVLKGSQFDILKMLYDEFDVEEVAFSMAENGYFDEEPIVVVPKKLPKSFEYTNFPNSTDLQKALEKLIRVEEIQFWVIEGNRRTATAKILTDTDLREKLGIGPDFPVAKNKEVENDLKEIPAIVYFNREDVSPYLGVRHIAGILKWEAYAKALYIAKKIDEINKRLKNIDKSVEEIQKKIGDRSDVIKKQYMSYKVVEQAVDEINFDIREIKNRFSLVQVALNSTSIRAFLEVKSYKEVDFSKSIVPEKKLKNLEYLLTWIYGNGRDKPPILTDSRNITKLLAPVLSSKEATSYLIKYNDLELAYERSEGEKSLLIKKIDGATKGINYALSIAYKYKTAEVKAAINECYTAIAELKKMVNS